MIHRWRRRSVYDAHYFALMDDSCVTELQAALKSAREEGGREVAAIARRVLDRLSDTCRGICRAKIEAWEIDHWSDEIRALAAKEENREV